MSPSRLAVTTLTLALLASSCGSEREAEPVRNALRFAEGDRWSSEMLGLSVTKPEGWVFGEATSIVRDAGERPEWDPDLWGYVETPLRKPAVAMSPRSAPRVGVDPVLRVYAVPIKKVGTESGYALLTETPLPAVLRGNVSAKDTRPGFEILQDASELQVAGRDAAFIEVTYRLGGPDDTGAGVYRNDASEPGPAVVEQRWVMRREGVYFFLEGIAAAPLDPAVAEVFDRIVASVRIDG